MKRFCLVLLAVVASAFSQQAPEKSNLGIFAETRLMRIAGMKPIGMPKLPFGMKLSSKVRDALPGTPSKGLTVRLWSPVTAPDDASASLAIPPGLQLGDKLDLEIYRPVPPAPPTSTTPSDPATPTPQHPTDFTIKIYWGSSDTVPENQPKVFSMANLSPEARAAMSSRMAQAHRSPTSGMFVDKGSSAYWPNSAQNGSINKDASLVGTYALSTSFAGSTTIEAPANIDFLAPLEITSPNLDEPVSLEGSLAFQWNPVPNCMGIAASAFGIADNNTLILWTSSPQYGERAVGDLGYLQMAEVNRLAKEHVLLSGDATSVTIPAGIFKDCSVAMFNMVGYGPGTAREDSKPVARIQTKTDLMVVLTGNSKGRPRGKRGAQDQPRR